MKNSGRLQVVQGIFILFIALISCKEISKKPEQQTQQVNEPQSNPESIPYTNLAVRTFEGAWFTIKYPSDFTVRSSMRSLSSADGYDSAFFTSPDKLVEFYAFSPQWDGNAYDITLNPMREYLIDKDVRNLSDRTETLFTIAAKDGSYKRSYREVKQYESSVNWVLGIKYSSERAYQKYQQAYVRFKKSLEQYADGYPG
jgi:glucose/arabinose dehydrogenase